MIDYNQIEKKWQAEWEKAKVFEAEPSDKKSILITAAFPYVNSPQHIGHLRTYATADAYARYMRMKGYNVLYPMAFQPSGLPVLGMAKRIANGDNEIISDFRNIYLVPDNEIAKMKDPLYLANYFVNDIETGMKEAGYSIDWRRRFVSLDPIFSKMVEWQFSKLKARGLLTQGTHPVGWCTNEGNAVGGHDTKGDIQPKIEELTTVKFKDVGSNAYFICSTYRPETLYGTTNLFVNEGIAYVTAKVGGEEYYMSKDAATMLGNQFEVIVEKEISANELLAKKAINPINKEEVPILPGFFVKADVGTGIVMSVPAHAPFDYVALERLKAKGYAMPQMQYKTVLTVESQKMKLGQSLGQSDLPQNKGVIMHPEVPALAYLELFNANPNSIDGIIEAITKAIYKEESRFGVMTTGKYAGKPEPEARDAIKADLIKSRDAFTIYIIANDEPVICRCGTRVVVKVVSDQWFINYGDEQWKKSVREYLPKIAIVPEKLRHTYENVVEWIDLRATERAQGLGTPFPYNTKHIIESLSDSTIYPMLYTFYHILASASAKPENMKAEFFDFVATGAGTSDSVAAATGIDKMVVQKCKDQFDYWYAYTSRHSGSDLISNHLTMYIFNHLAIFPESFWPKQIVSNGLVNYEGEKMSKSMGNIVPLRSAISKYGADPLRMVEVAGADLDTESGFSPNTIGGIKQRNEILMNAIGKLGELGTAELGHLDYWLYSRLNSKIKNATAAMEELSFRNAYNEIYYNTIVELKRYFDRGGENSMAAREVMEKVSLMLQPVMPHISEELWHALGNSTLAAQERWPVSDDSMINKEVEDAESIVLKTEDDIAAALSLTSRMPQNAGKKPKTIRIIVPDDWKTTAYNLLAEKKKISDVIASIDNVDKGKISAFLSGFSKKMASLEKANVVRSSALKEAFESAKVYLSGKFGAEVVVEMESESSSARAARAQPEKPSIDVIW